MKEAFKTEVQFFPIIKGNKRKAAAEYLDLLKQSHEILFHWTVCQVEEFKINATDTRQGF